MARSKSGYLYKDVTQTQAKKIESEPEEIRRTLTQLLGSQAPAVLWVKDRSYVVKTKLSDKTHPLKFILLEPAAGMDPQELCDVLKKQGTEECYITFYTKTSSVVGVPTFLIKANSEGYFFKIPEKIVKIDRRKEPRLKIPRGYRVEVSFELPDQPSKNIQKLVYDLSLSGLSFVVKKEETEQFPSGLEIKQFSFRLRNKLIISTATVKNQVPVMVDGVPVEYKVGVTLDSIDDESKDFIENYLIENIIQYIQS